MTLDSEVLGNFDKHVYFHGTSLQAVESIARRNFQVWCHDDEIGRYARGGNLGSGVYVSCNWRMALWFGPALIRVSVHPGTKLLNAALPPDRKILDYLQREFGHALLEKAPWEVIPRNKKLTQRELVTLFRYHYWQAWEKEYGEDRDGHSKWSKKRARHALLLRVFRNLLVRYGFDGYGNPADDNGLVVFAEDRLTLSEFVAEIPSKSYQTLCDDEFRQFQDLDEVKRYFQTHGSHKAKRLAGHVANLVRAKSPPI